MAKIYYWLSLLTLLIDSLITNATNINFQIEGLSGSLKKNVYAQLSSIQNEEFSIKKHFRTSINNTVRAALKALGYYEPKIDYHLKQLSTNGRQVLIIHINPGSPIRIGRINIILRGDSLVDEDYLALLDKRPAIGSILNHSDYDNFKKSLTDIAKRKGYFDSHFNKSQLGIVLNKNQAFWDIDYDSGQRYHFGNITFEGSQIRNEYLRNIIPFKNGDPFDSKRLAELDRRLSATGWFNSVVISPIFDKSHKNKVLSLHGITAPQLNNSIEASIGYSTNIGLRVKTLWKKPWINSYGHSLITNTSISALEQKLSFNYKAPLSNGPLEHLYFFKGGFKHINLSFNKLNSATFVISRHWNLSNNWQRTINLNYRLDYITKPQQAKFNSNIIMLLYPSLIINYASFLGSQIPTLGDSQQYSIYYSDTVWKSDVKFLVLNLKNMLIRTAYNKHRFVIRNNLSWIKTDNFKKLPLDLRCFADIDQNIRGYKYKHTIIKKDNSKLIRDSKAITNSLEYQYNIADKWWCSTFIDHGATMNNIHNNNFKIGIGINILWESPIGPIKLDLATPFYDKKKHHLQFYIGLGSEL